MGQQLRTQPAIHTGVPGIQSAPSTYGRAPGSMAVPLAGPPSVNGRPPATPVPQFAPAGRPPSPYAAALRVA